KTMRKCPRPTAKDRAMESRSGRPFVRDHDQGGVTLIRYRVRLADPSRHLLHVELRIDDPAPSLCVRMPSWIPGSYLLREFARHIVAIRGESGGRTLAAEQADKASWWFRGAERELIVTIEVYALDQSVRGAYFDGNRAYINGTCLFLIPEGHGSEPVELELEAPGDERCKDWRVATAMLPVAVDERGF